MTARELPDSSSIHTCSYYCDRPACVKAQRDQIRDAMLADSDPVTISVALESQDAELQLCSALLNTCKHFEQYKGSELNAADFSRATRWLAQRYEPKEPGDE